MRLSKDNWRKMINVDIPDIPPITIETIEEIKKDAQKYRGGMRISTGRIWTTEEAEEYRKKVKNTPLP